MMNWPIDGVVVSATPKRSLLGQQAFVDVTIRRGDGSEENLGTIAVPLKLADVLAPGTSGRFYFHDIVGSRGLHGFTAPGAATVSAFPRLVEHVLAVLALVNLASTIAWITPEGQLPLVPLMMGTLGLAAWATFRASREAIVHEFRHEAGLARASRRRSAAQRPRHQLV